MVDLSSSGLGNSKPGSFHIGWISLTETLPYAKIHTNMNPRKHSFLRAISSNIHSLGQCTLKAREKVMSDQQVTETPCNLIPALHGCYYQTLTLCVQGETLNS
jgi:hypothetical protein